MSKRLHSRNDIIAIINACKDMRLRTAILFIASTGARLAEAMAIRIRDLHLETNHPTVTFRAETTKNRLSRTIPLTRETAEAIRIWLKVKYEPYPTKFSSVRTFVKPTKRDTDMVLAMWHKANFNPNAEHLGENLRWKFSHILELIGKDELEESGRQHRFTLGSFRRYVKTTISNVSSFDFSEYILGHRGWRMTYFRMRESEVNELWAKVEPYLTFISENGADLVRRRFSEELASVHEELKKMRADMEVYRRENVAGMAVINNLVALYQQQLTAPQPTS
jgi:integrase